MATRQTLISPEQVENIIDIFENFTRAVDRLGFGQYDPRGATPFTAMGAFEKIAVEMEGIKNELSELTRAVSELDLPRTDK